MEEELSVEDMLLHLDVSPPTGLAHTHLQEITKLQPPPTSWLIGKLQFQLKSQTKPSEPEI